MLSENLDSSMTAQEVPVDKFPLSEKTYHKNVPVESTRKGFGRGLKKAGDENKRVVALSADLTESVQMDSFKEAFPERFVQVGVAEQNLVTVASGMAAMGKVPFAASYAAFSPGRNWEQIRTTICLNDRPVKLVGSHAGLSVGPDGATHQMLEDIALMRSLPNMVVVVPGDSLEAEKATLALVKTKKPSYLRLSREATPIFTDEETPFKVGQAYVLKEGIDVTLFGTGIMTHQCLLAAEKLEKNNLSVQVVHVPTVKPLDEKTILNSLAKTGIGVTVEDGQAAGGFGSAVAEIVSEKKARPILRIGVKDQFGQSGQADELYKAYGLDADSIVKSVEQFVKDNIRQTPGFCWVD